MRWHEAVPALDALGVAYDSTLGFAERPGLAGRVLLPVPALELSASGRPGSSSCRCVLMDATLAEPATWASRRPRAQAVGEQVLDRLAEAGGCAAILWHNDRFDRVYGRGWGRVYEAPRRGRAPPRRPRGHGGELAAYWKEQRCAS